MCNSLCLNVTQVEGREGAEIGAVVRVGDGV
jgi:hypothetical protein